MKKFLLLLSIIFGILFVFFVKDEDKPKVVTAKKVRKIEPESTGINSRQNILLTLLKQHKSLQMKEIEKRIQTVNVRTLRRDLDKLQKLGLISKTGSTKAAVYRVK